MNIFVLHSDPVIAAQMACDKHVVKMILESAQMLCSVFESAPYKRTHYNHPCSIWVRASKQNYQWLLDYSIALHVEYQRRYGANKTHASYKVILWCIDNVDSLQLADIGLTPFALALPNDCVVDGDVVRSYRNYYLKYKRHILKWTNASTPDWVSHE